MKLSKFLSLVSLSLIFFVTGCGGSSSNSNPQSQSSEPTASSSIKEEQEKEEEKEKGTASFIEITDKSTVESLSTLTLFDEKLSVSDAQKLIEDKFDKSHRAGTEFAYALSAKGTTAQENKYFTLSYDAESKVDDGSNVKTIKELLNDYAYISVYFITKA